MQLRNAANLRDCIYFLTRSWMQHRVSDELANIRWVAGCDPLPRWDLMRILAQKAFGLWYQSAKQLSRTRIIGDLREELHQERSSRLFHFNLLVWVDNGLTLGRVVCILVADKLMSAY